MMDKPTVKAIGDLLYEEAELLLKESQGNSNVVEATMKASQSLLLSRLARRLYQAAR